MSQTPPRVFKPSLFKRALGWGLLLSFGGWLAGLILYVIWNHARMPADELWSALGMGLFLLLIAALGAASLRAYFILGDDYIDVVRPWGTRRFAVSELSGYGTIVIVVSLVPLLHVRLYRAGPVEIGKIAVNFGDRADVTKWFAQRLALVDDPGSLVRPAPRYRNPAAAQREQAR